MREIFSLHFFFEILIFEIIFYSFFFFLSHFFVLLIKPISLLD